MVMLLEKDCFGTLKMQNYLLKRWQASYTLARYKQLKFDKMEKFEIHIGKIYDLESKTEKRTNI